MKVTREMGLVYNKNFERYQFVNPIGERYAVYYLSDSKNNRIDFFLSKWSSEENLYIPLVSYKSVKLNVSKKYLQNVLRKEAKMFYELYGKKVEKYV